MCWWGASTKKPSCHVSSSCRRIRALTIPDFFLKIPHLGSGEDSWNFFTLSLIPGSPSLLVNNDHEEERIEEEQQIVIFSLYDRTITSAPFAPFRLGDLNSCSRTHNWGIFLVLYLCFYMFFVGRYCLWYSCDAVLVDGMAEGCNPCDIIISFLMGWILLDDKDNVKQS